MEVQTQTTYNAIKISKRLKEGVFSGVYPFFGMAELAGEKKCGNRPPFFGRIPT